MTGSNGGAGGVFLDGTGGSYHSQGQHLQAHFGFYLTKFRFFFSTSKVFSPQAPCLSNVLGGQRVRCKNECLDENSIICDF